MMAELKGLHSPDVADLQTWTPESSDFAILLQITAGPASGRGEASFDTTLCSSTWVAARVAEARVLEVSHLLIMAKYNYEQLHEYLSERVSACEGDTWRDVAREMSRIGRWEFEHYDA
jgi:hypothetical protein